MVRYLSSIVLLLLVLISSAPQALAQAAPGADPFTISINPSYPRPNETITITIRSTLLPLSASTVVVSVNGTEIDRGSGVFTTQTVVGGAGVATRISVAVTSGGTVYRKELTVRPADVALVVEPISTAHPFYKGGSLVASEGRVRIIALPNLRTTAGALIPSNNLVYTWRLGEQILENYSGIGKSVLVATAPIRYRDALVRLTVTTQDSSVVAETSVLIAPTDPIVRIYRYDPLLGPDFNTALSGRVTMNTEEETLRAVPFFFSTFPPISWQMNGVLSSSSQDLTVRSTGGGTGSALLEAFAQSGTAFQTARSPLTLDFGESRSLGIFGF